MEKVKLPKEVAEAIESLRRYNSDTYIIYKQIQATMDGGKFEQIPNIDSDALIRALYIGYEVEQTPEDKVREYYTYQRDNMVNSIEGDAKKKSIIHTLDLLGIKIEGVNAE